MCHGPNSPNSFTSSGPAPGEIGARERCEEEWALFSLPTMKGIEQKKKKKKEGNEQNGSWEEMLLNYNSQWLIVSLSECDRLFCVYLGGKINIVARPIFAVLHKPIDIFVLLQQETFECCSFFFKLVWL